MPNFKLVLSYDGSRYRGWQRQGNTGNTIQEKTEEILSRILGRNVEVAGAGRTDAGVHARMQTASFRAETERSAEEILAELRRYLPEDIGAEGLEIAPPRFHARLNCKGKTYAYRIWNSDAPCVFERKYVYRHPEPLDEAAMARAARILEGEHDFSAFHTGRLSAKKSAVRRLERVDIVREGKELRCFMTGDGFLYHMARILTGTLLEVGAGRMDADAVAGILERRDRKNAGPTAPAGGLCLWEIFY